MNLWPVPLPPAAAASSDATIALNRFGLGARPKDNVAGDPRGWLTAQFARYRPVPPQIAAGTGMDEPCIPRESEYVPGQTRTLCTTVLDRALAARFEIARTSDTPFVERLVHFWSNHFAVSTTAGRGRVGVYEFDAIRPHVLGNFRDLLRASAHHPAMLIYLDQHNSAGPHSRARGRNRNAVENLAREILELHTLGVRTGYTQADVTEFALALTGWTVENPVHGGVGHFVFQPERHEPGARSFMGHTLPEGGEAQGEAILDMVAAHPATARHIATKLACHFAGDDPAPALVDRLAAAFRDSNGDLPTVYRALIAAPEPWTPGRLKYKTPWEWLVSIGRATGTDPIPADKLGGALRELGQGVWMPKSPAGYDDIAASWAAPDALMRRVQLAEAIAKTLPPTLGGSALAPAVLGGAAAAGNTATVLTRAPDTQSALALLFVAPEFLYR